MDFATVVATVPAERKDRLRAYLDRNQKGRWRSYKGFRAVVPDIAGVRRGLDPSAPPSREDVHAGLKLTCHPQDLGFNKEAADVLFNFIRPQNVEAYDDHPKGSLRIGPDRTIPMGVEHYVISEERGLFRWVYPRRERLLGNIPKIAMSLIHHNYVRGDFEEFEVEMIDLSCEPMVGPRGGIKAGTTRNPHIVPLKPDDVMPREELNEQADSIYALLMEIADEAT